MAPSRLFIANRGEIALRIHRAAKELGLWTIQTYSVADADSLAAQMADEAVHIGPHKASKSYLNIEAILDAAQRIRATPPHVNTGRFCDLDSCSRRSCSPCGR